MEQSYKLNVSKSQIKLKYVVVKEVIGIIFKKEREINTN